MKNSKKGSMYIISFVFILLTALYVAGLLLITNIEQRNIIRDQWRLSALHLAEAGVDDAIWALKNNKWGGSWNTSGNPYIKSVASFQDEAGKIIGSYYITITDPLSYAPVVASKGYSPSINADNKIERVVKVNLSVYNGHNPANIKAAITTNSYTQTKGSLIVDGRNHDLFGNFIADASGTRGIHTTATYSQEGNSQAGGTAGGVDYAPSKPCEPTVVTNLADWSPAGYPTAPDMIMNYPDGTLKAKAQSGEGGSQYVTSPSLLTSPLSGVTYVEIPDTWIVGASFDLTGTGVLVIHSSSGNTACIKNLTSGIFKGIIIADNVIQIHNTIIGAIVTISPNPPEGSTIDVGSIGNGTGQILYSAEAVNNAFNVSSPPIGVNITTWQEQ